VTGRIAVYVEVTPRRTFAGAVEWPGWCRSGKTVDDALQALAALDPRRGQVVELRFFSGLSVEETAEVLNVSAETVKRDWRLAKAWLLRELNRRDGNDS